MVVSNFGGQRLRITASALKRNNSSGSSSFSGSSGGGGGSGEGDDRQSQTLSASPPLIGAVCGSVVASCARYIVRLFLIKVYVLWYGFHQYSDEKEQSQKDQTSSSVLVVDSPANIYFSNSRHRRSIYHSHFHCVCVCIISLSNQHSWRWRPRLFPFIRSSRVSTCTLAVSAAVSTTAAASTRQWWWWVGRKVSAVHTQEVVCGSQGVERRRISGILTTL